MNHRHQSNDMCIIVFGREDTHPWSATKVGSPTPATTAVDLKQKKTTNKILIPVIFPVSRYKLIPKKLQRYTGLIKKKTICYKFLRTHLRRSQFLEHCRSEDFRRADRKSQ